MTPEERAVEIHKAIAKATTGDIQVHVSPRGYQVTITSKALLLALCSDPSAIIEHMGRGSSACVDVELFAEFTI